MTLSKLPERPLAAQSRKNEIPHNNFNCRSQFFPGLDFLGNLRAAIPLFCNEQKQARMRDCHIFSRFHSAKTGGNARGLHFLYIILNSTEKHRFSSTLISKNGRECERGACFHMFFYNFTGKNEECKHVSCVFSTSLEQNASFF